MEIRSYKVHINKLMWARQNTFAVKMSMKNKQKLKTNNFQSAKDKNDGECRPHEKLFCATQMEATTP